MCALQVGEVLLCHRFSVGLLIRNIPKIRPFVFGKHKERLVDIVSRFGAG